MLDIYSQNQKSHSDHNKVYEVFLQAWRDLDVNLLFPLLSDNFILRRYKFADITELEQAKQVIRYWFDSINKSGYEVIIEEVFGEYTDPSDKEMWIKLNNKAKTSLFFLVITINNSRIDRIQDYSYSFDFCFPKNGRSWFEDESVLQRIEQRMMVLNEETKKLHNEFQNITKRKIS